MGTEALWAPIAGAVLGSVVSSMFGGKKQQDAPAPPPIAPAITAPQASVAPEVSTVRNKVTNAAGPGEASTLLTGIGGVDPKTLSLGKSTLLGE